MPTYSALPAELSFRTFRGDEFGVTIDFDLDLTGYTVQTSIFTVGRTSDLAGNIATTTTEVAQFGTTILSASQGRVRLSLTETQTTALSAQNYRWLLRWIAPGTVTKTVLSGFLEVVPDMSVASGTDTSGTPITVATAASTGLASPAGGLINSILWG